MLLLALACTTAEDGEVRFEVLSDARLLRRISLDVRGTLPNLAELDAVEADPSRIETYRDEWMDGPRFEDRMVDVYAEQWQTRIDLFHVFWTEYAQLDDDGPTVEYSFERSVSDEPLRLLAHIAATDAPWTDAVNADYTMANPLLEEIWPLEREPGEGWTEARYTDDRPAVGVLATNGLWWRYHSTVTNFNRARVSVVMRLLVCHDIQAQSVSFGEAPSLTEGDSLENALREEPYCVGCHSVIDPVASSLFGFWPANEHSAPEIDRYHPEREKLGEEMLGVTPAWYGTPVDGLWELGPVIAADPRYDRCAVESMASGMWRRPIDPIEDAALLDRLEEDFVENGRRVKPLIVALSDTREYRAGDLGSAADEATVEAAVPVRLLTPDQLQSALWEATGFSWRWEGYEQLRNDQYGYRLMLGGVDGVYLTRPQTRPGMTWAASAQRLAEAAAYTAAQSLGTGDGLLGEVSTGASAGDDDFDEALEDTVRRLHARRPDATERQDLAALWSLGEDPAEGWTIVVTALLRDPEFLTY